MRTTNTRPRRRTAPRIHPATPDVWVVVSVVEVWAAGAASAGGPAESGGGAEPAASAGGGGFPTLPLSAAVAPAAVAELSGEPAGADDVVVSVTLVCCFLLTFGLTAAERVFF